MSTTDSTDLYCVMGHPVAHSQSPWIHARFAAMTGQALRYERRLIALDGFAEGLRAFQAEGGRGCNITVPFKFEAASLPGVRLSARARLAGAANVLTFQADPVHTDPGHTDHITAENTDGIGLVQDITRHAGLDLRGARVLLVGAGGAGAGVLGPLLEARLRALHLVNRSVERAQQLAQRHAALASACGVELTAGGLDAPGQAWDVVINASASSLAGQASPVGPQVLRAGTLACDLMYGAPAQGFIDWAQSHGAVGRDGLGMLVEQAAEAFAIWRGVRPDGAPVLRELREALQAQGGKA